MKLYAESLQEKLDEIEKGRGGSSKVDSNAQNSQEVSSVLNKVL